MFNYFNRKIDPIYIEKMNNNELTVEDILDQEEIISDIINKSKYNIESIFLK